MKKNNKQLMSDVATILVMILFVYLLYLCNHIVIFMQDDLWYWTNLVTGERIASVGDIVESQIWHYQNWGGRTVAHTLLQFLLWGDGRLCNVLNTVVFDALALFIAKAGRKWNLQMILLSASMMVVFNPNMLDTLFWQSGTVNYLYMTLLCFPLAWLYLKALTDEYRPFKNAFTGILTATGTLIWGLLAGWTNENMGPTLFLLSVVVIILYTKKHKRIRLWMIFGSLSLAAGSACMLLSPGNRIRKAEIVSYGSWKLDLCRRTLDYLRGGLEWLFPMIVFALFSYILYRVVLKKRTDTPTLLILGCGIVSYLGLALSPHVPERSLFGTMCFLIWGSLRMLADVFEEVKKERFRIGITLLIAGGALYKIFFFWAQGVGWYRYS